MIDTSSWINPSIYKIREAFIQQFNNIISITDNYAHIIIIGNLASKFGIAVVPLLAKILYNEYRKEIFSFVIMPFGFEKDKIYQSSVALSFTTKFSNSTIVIDNNSFLKNNPEISFSECYRITNNAIKDVITISSKKGYPSNFNIISTSKESEKIEDAFYNSMSMLNDIKTANIEKAFVFVYPGKEKVDKIDTIIETIGKIIDNAEKETTIVSNANKLSKMHLVGKTNNLIFSYYDPLNQFISKENTLDFEPEINQNIKEISFLNDIETQVFL
jgi:cell division protein FtsZ